MLMCLGVILMFALFAGAGIGVSLMLGYLILSVDRGLRLSKLSLSIFCGAAITGMTAYAASLGSLRDSIVFFDEIPESVHLVMLVVAGASGGWLFLRLVALMFPSVRAQRS